MNSNGRHLTIMKSKFASRECVWLRDKIELRCAGIKDRDRKQSPVWLSKIQHNFVLNMKKWLAFKIAELFILYRSIHVASLIRGWRTTISHTNHKQSLAIRMTKVSVQSPEPATLTATTTVPVRVSLSATGLVNVRSKDKINLNDFELIVGEDQCQYRCPWSIPHFISRRIAALQEIDNTICSYRVETSDIEHEFKKSISLCWGEAITIEPKNREFHGALGKEFENEELLPLHVLIRVKTLMETCFESTWTSPSDKFWLLIVQMRLNLLDHIFTRLISQNLKKIWIINYWERSVIDEAPHQERPYETVWRFVENVTDKRQPSEYNTIQIKSSFFSDHAVPSSTPLNALHKTQPSEYSIIQIKSSLFFRRRLSALRVDRRSRIHVNN
jgi:hypothetical protein